MKNRKHFVLADYTREFGIKPKKVFGIVITINGFWFLRNYKDRYRKSYEDFKLAMLYEKPQKQSYHSLLRNIYYDLHAKRKEIESQNKRCKNKLPSTTTPKQNSNLVAIFKYWFQFYSSSRRVNYCYKVQLRYLTLSLLHCEALASSAGLKLPNYTLRHSLSQYELIGILEWTGTKIEFLQWAYAFLKSNRINAGVVELRKSVEILARFFNVDIGKSTYSDLSKSIHQYNDDYFPKIFEDMSNSYLQYITIRKEKRAE